MNIFNRLLSGLLIGLSLWTALLCDLVRARLRELPQAVQVQAEPRGCYPPPSEHEEPTSTIARR